MPGPRGASVSHTLLTLTLSQVSEAGSDGQLSELVSRVAFVDLAGSRTLTDRAFVREIAFVNKSITCLRHVMAQLSELGSAAAAAATAAAAAAAPTMASDGPLAKWRFRARQAGLAAVAVAAARPASAAKQRAHIPFRDSVLTALLRENLTGNSKTVVVGALAVADAAHEDTAATLAFLGRCKRVVTSPTINQARRWRR